MAIDMGRLKNKETIILPIIWERDPSRGIMKGCTIVSWKILNFVNLNSNMIELKSLYPDGQGRAERCHTSYDARRVFSIQKELVDLSQ